MEDPRSDKARELRDEGWSLFEIGRYFGITLSETRRLLDLKARLAHERWARR